MVVCVCAAQSPTEPQYGYEVASVKKAAPRQGIRIGPGPQGGLRTENTSLLTLITFAYDIRDYQLLDAPGWVKGDAFDVSFTPDKPETPMDPSQGIAQLEPRMRRQQQRLRAVLRDRFGLVLRTETRQLPIYTLTPVKGGHKLQAPDGTRKGPSLSMSDKGGMTGIGVNMAMVTRSLGETLGRPVVDETGITTPFDFKLEWKPDAVATGAGDQPVNDGEGASIFTALREQLGLQLQSGKGPVTVYVVEKVSKPEEN